MRDASKPGAAVLLARLSQQAEDAREKRDYAIRAAAREGMSRRDIARAVGLSHQRVTQIVNEGSNHGS